MIECDLFEYSDIGGEDEDDLTQKVSAYDEAVIWGTDWTTETITNQLTRKNIDLFPKFQRRDAWSRKAKSKFIESLMLGLPIPQIILAEKKEKKGRYIVIDGKQRLLTIRQFFADKDSEEFEPFKLTGLEILNELNGMSFEDIEKDSSKNNLVDQLYNHTIRTTVIKNWPNEDFLFTVFLRLNTGSVKLSPQELRQALHPGEFIDRADEFSVNSKIIQKMLKIKQADYRMRDVEIVVRYFSNKYFLEDYRGNLKNSFDDTVKKLNKDWNVLSNKINDDLVDLEEAIEFTFKVFDQKNSFCKWENNEFKNAFNRAIFDIMVFYFSQKDVRENSIGKEYEIVELFKDLCSNDVDFLNSFEHTTKSIPNTYKRFNTWGESLANILNIKLIVPNLEDNRLVLANSKNG